ncbi:NADP-dependent oxidoreductase [Chitinophaga sp. 22620]|uniref:NADP-dependent oxidoreductase n=1 Tax=Chitinophaga sp. 22620 TaxID=3453952 RepID=UPI003F86F595
MKAILLKAYGPVENLAYETIDTPAIAEDEVLVQVKAISINPVDAKTRKGGGIAGRLQAPFPFILGWDISGIVTSSKSTRFKAGDEVFGMVNFPGIGNAYAEYVAAPAAHLALKPANISHAEAAAATLAALTAWQALVTHAPITPGQRVLIGAAAGGVGHYAVQIAKYLGAHVTGTASAANRDLVLSLGADAFVDYTAQPYETVVKDMDFVLEPMGGDEIDRALQVIKPGGSIISLPSGLNQNLMEKAAARQIKGIRMMVASSGEDMQKLAELLEKGIVRSHVSKTFSFEEIAAAHTQIESGKTAGKIVIEI